eukprot:Nitzschia sp. Nitz4//scaffold67_size101165//1728//3143//NITZ4_004518-RA/size101165-processed-gene-0.54-mRNA-1//-1//CDS//3329556441//3460//frame0
MLDTRTHKIELQDGLHRELTANMIAENLYSLASDDGPEELHFSEIPGHRKTAQAIAKGTQDATVQGQANTHKTRTTKGWEIRVEWRDGTSTWLPLVEMKNSNPLELAEYATANQLTDEPAFAWWVKHAMRKRDQLIAKVKSKYWRASHKFGIHLPHLVEEAYELDCLNNNTHWADAIEKEMKRILTAMERFDGTEAEACKQLIGYKQIKCHMIFDDVKMEGLKQKARFVAGGHTTETPRSITYTSVVIRETVRIALLIAALNDLNVCAADVTNAYLNAKCREKIWFIAGKEFGDNLCGSVLIIRKALYGLKSSAAAWRSLLSSRTFDQLGFKPSRDPDVWMTKNNRPGNPANPYYEYVLLIYVDDILHVSHYPTDDDPVMKQLGAIYCLKNGSIGEPSLYLGADIGRVMDDTGREMWFMSLASYVQAAVSNVEGDIPKGWKLKGRVQPPYPADYALELDATNYLADADIQK